MFGTFLVLRLFTQHQQRMDLTLQQKYVTFNRTTLSYSIEICIDLHLICIDFERWQVTRLETA